MQHRQAFHGVTLVEYGLIGALIMVFAIAAVTQLGEGLNGRMVNLKGDLTRSANGQASGGGGSGGGGGSQQPTGPGGIGNVVPPPGPGEEQACLSGGYCVNIPTIPGGTRLSSTTGALGGQLTHGMANAIRQIGDQLRADPDTDPTLLNLITQLANNGHGIGDSIDNANTWCPPGVNCGQLAADGSQVSSILRQNLGNIDHSQSGFQSTHQELQAYLAAHPGALPPAVVGVINAEAGQINTIADAFSQDSITPSTCQAAGDTACSQWNVTDTLLVHQDANTICSSGGGHSQCTR